MTTAIKLRQILLSESEMVVKAIVAQAAGKPLASKYDVNAIRIVWDAIIPMIQNVEDPTPMAKLTDKDISSRIDTVLEQVASGDITVDEAKKVMELIQIGFELTELPRLLETIEKLDT